MNIITIATIISFVTAIVWLLIVYRLDKHEKEPISLLAKVFIVSFFLSFVAGFLNSFSTKIFGLQGSFITVGFIEEGVKFLAVYWAVFKNKEFNDPIDGVMYASASALGFAFAENIEYNFMIISIHREEFLISRSFLPLLHVLLSSIWGYALGMYKQFIFSKQKLITFWLASAIIHSLYDLTVGSISFVMILTFVVLGVIFLMKISYLNRISYKNNRYLIKCPTCNKFIFINSLFCNFCGNEVNVDNNTVDIFCKECKNRVKRDWKFCRKCGARQY